MSERFVNGECKRTLNTERKTSHKAKRAHGEQMQKKGKVKRVRNCLYIKHFIVLAHTTFINNTFYVVKFVF